jgi:hydrogenase nickel incorporation protein HypA/HybF
MHEFSVAKPVVEKVLSLAREKKAKAVKSIKVSVGELILLGAGEEFKFWLKEMLGKDTVSKNAQIKIDIVKAKVKCRKCGYEGGLEINHEHSHTHPVFLCPRCEDADLEIKQGRDCVIEKVELEV